MKTIKNKTHEPLRVPLPRGRTLHLNPNHTGQVADVEFPPLAKLIEAGEVEVVDEGARGGTTASGGGGGHESTHGHVPNKVVHKSGDR
jgi:hypothetical protein